MHSVRISSTYKIVIPADIRKSMNLRPGENMQVFESDGRIEIVRLRPVREMRGRFKGIDTQVNRD